VAVQSVKAMPENQVPQIWGESVTQFGTPDAADLGQVWDGTPLETSGDKNLGKNNNWA
jgi:hypothetical protein